MDRKNLGGYKFSKIPLLRVQRPILQDVSEELNQLLAVKRSKKEELMKHMYEKVIKTRLKSTKTSCDHEKVPMRPVTASDLEQLTEKCTKAEMSKFQEKSIRRRIQAGGLEYRYADLLNQFVEEMKMNFTKIVHDAGVNMKIKLHTAGKFTVPPYKFVGKTENYSQFLSARKHFQTKWIFHYPVIRKIQKECVLNVPPNLFRIQFFQILKIDQIQFEYTELARLATQIVTFFYSKITAILEKDRNKIIYDIDSRQIFKVATGILTLHISDSISRTLEEIVDFTEAKNPKPYMFLDVTFIGGLVLKPTPDEVIDIYHELIDKILGIRNDIFDLETHKLRGKNRRPINLYITEEFVDRCKENIKINVYEQFQPILEYLEGINEHLSAVYKDIRSDEFFENIVDMVFEEGCRKIDFYRGYLDKVMFIPDFEFFRIAKVSFVDYKKNVHDGLRQNIESVFGKLSSQHLWEVTDLCETFEHIKKRAETKPETTEELIEIGKFMTWVRQEEFQVLENRVTESLAALCKIIDLGTLAEEHIELNAKSIQWLTDILPIMEEQSTIFDGLKYDAEEKLQKVVEDVSELVKNVFPLLVILDEMDDIDKVKLYLNFITLHMKKIREIEAQIDWINQEEVTLSFPKSTYSEYDELKNYVYPFHHLLNVCLEVQQNLYSWQDGPFDMLNYESTKIAVEQYQKELSDTYKTYRQKLRQAQDENVALRFRGTVDDPDILNWPAPLKLCGIALRRIEAFEPSVKVMKIVCNDCLRKRHWKAMSEIAGTDVTPNAGTTLRKIMQVDFFSKMKEYEIISVGATKEQLLFNQLNDLKIQWEDIHFTVEKHEKYDVRILVRLDDIESVITDHNIIIRNMKSSVFVTPHEIEVRNFFNDITKVHETIQNWLNVQNVLLKLYPIVSLKELIKIIPKETKLLGNIINTYNKHTEVITRAPNALEVVKETNISKDLVSSVADLEIVYFGVSTYLDKIRNDFPRFYFISNDEFIKAISDSKVVLISQHFLKKLFENIHHLNIDNSDIEGITGNNFEELKFKNRVVVEPTLEGTFKKVEVEMKSTIKTEIFECFKNIADVDLKSKLSKYCEQALKISSQCYWTENVEMALCINSDKNLEICLKNLEASIEEKLRTIKDNLTNNQKCTIKNLIISDAYTKELMNKILNSKRVSLNNFEWKINFKYGLKNDLVNITSMSSVAEYMYEYAGICSHIISTNTDRCFRMLINTYFMNYSGLLQGKPDGGKFETLKMLAGIFGNFLIKFVCSPHIRSTTLEKFLKGSLMCGSWICLENFSDLQENVISGLSECLFNLELAKKEGVDHCFMGEKPIYFKQTCFITISSIDRIYNNLPESVKKHIRTITMLKPDYASVAEIFLYSSGFKNAAVLSKKISFSLGLLQESLSTKQNCHFGMRKLLDILTESEKIKTIDSNLDETDLIFSAITRVLQKEILSDNYKEFHVVLHHIFPDSVITEEKNTILETIKELCEMNNLQWTSQYGLKILEVYECITNYKSILLVGKTCSSKTTILDVCKKTSETIENQKHHLHFVAPNCYTYKSLYGYLLNPNEWKDGLITKLFRENIDDSLTEQYWIVFDGDINAEWIDYLKPVLKERKLFLESGETVDLGSRTRVVFELDSLRNCSPSVVSQSTVIYINKLIPVWQAIINNWTLNCTSYWMQGFQHQINDIFTWLIPPCLEFFRQNCHQVYRLSEINLIKNMIAITQLFLDDVCAVGKKEEDLKNLPTWIHATIIQAGVVGLGGLLDASSKQKFDEFYKLLWRGQDPLHPYPNSFGKLEVGIPHDGSLLDYQYIYKQRGNWKLYHDLLKAEKIQENTYMCDFLVPTADTMRYSYILTLFIKNKLPVLLFGPPCTGKTILIEDTLRNKIDERSFEMCHINFDSYFDASKTQRIILSKTNKRKNSVYHPPMNKNYVIFIDNLNQISRDKYGNSSCVEVLRQYVDHDIWYDSDNFEEIKLRDATIISAMGTTEGGGKKLQKRFLRHFHVFGIDEITDEVISRVYNNVLSHVWRQNGFPSDIGTVTNQLVEATLYVYKKISQHCRPSLSRSYYRFNLYSFAGVIKGCALLKKETYDGNKKIYIKLWIHETFRTFGDRLDNNVLDSEIRQALNQYFGESMEEIAETPIENIVMSTISDKDHHKYEEITDLKHVSDCLRDELIKYNYAHDIKLNVFFFDYALEKLFKISRIFSLSPGNGLFLGSCGLGRSALTKLLSFIYGYKFFQPTITQGYSVESWKKELKLVLKETGALEHKSVFLVSEKDLLDEEFLQHIDDLLQNGDVTDIFNAEEKQEILELSRLSAQGGNRNIDISSSAVFLHFHKRYKLNLHIILCLSNDTRLRKRLRSFPALLNCQIMLWSDFPDEALQNIAETMTANLDIPVEDKFKSVTTFIYFHRDFQLTARNLKLQLHTSPICFVHLVALFVQIYAEERKCIENKRKRFSQGLAKLSYAADQILDMQRVLAEYQPQLAEMTAKAVEMTEQIALETNEVERASELVRQDEKIASEQAVVAQILKSECEAELAQAIPILEDAISALNTLKPSDITLVKSMKNPPDAIKLVMAAVCVIKDVKPDRIPDPSTGRKTYDYWGPSKRILGDMNFLQSLKDFDKDHIKAEIMVKIRKDFLPHKDFKPHVVAKASSAAEGLCKWIIAMDMYDKVAKEVAPKKEKLGKAETEYAETVAVLNAKKEEVKRIEEKLAGLNALLEDANKKQLKLQREVDICNRKLASAQKLIGSLSEEQVRWTRAVEHLENQNQLVLGNILLTTGIVAYLAPVDYVGRNEVLKKWREFISAYTACSPDFTMTQSFSSQLKIDVHKRGDFLSDKFFLQNILIHDFSECFSMFIDPDYRAVTWVKKIEKRNHLTLTTFSHKRFLNDLVDCINFGKPILIHRIKRDVPTFLYEFIAKRRYVVENKQFILVNGAPQQLDSNFRLYLVCNLHRPDLRQEMFNKLTVINFATTRDYLQRHFLKTVTEIEKPQIKKQKKNTYVNKNNYRESITKTEIEILETLCESEADILEDEVSIKILEDYKFVLKDLREKYFDSQIEESDIENFMDQYKSVASFVANLYFCVSQLKFLHHVYQFSFDWFDYLYYRSIIHAEKSKLVEKKCENINKYFISQLYKHLNFSLYDKDRFLVALLLTVYVSRHRGKLDENELTFFLEDHEIPIDLSNSNELLNVMEDLPCFRNFSSNFKENFTAWKRFISSGSVLPTPWDTEITAFQKLILIKKFRPQDLYSGMGEMILAELGPEFLERPRWTIDDIFNESYSLSPILFLHNEGNEFMEELYILLKKKEVIHTFRSFCLSDRSSNRTDVLLEEARKNGLWLLIQNCHIDEVWLKNLENRIVGMNYENTNEDFRLWLTAEPTVSVPLELLQNSIKVIYDFPGDYKGNVERLMCKKYISEYFFNGCPGKQEIFTKFLYGLVCFHSCIVRRKNHDSLLWKPPFIINENDLKISIALLQSQINRERFVHTDVEIILYVIGHYQYGTQVDDTADLELINTLLRNFLSPELIRNRCYCFGNVKEYGLPKKCDYPDYWKLVRNLPTPDNVEIFGITKQMEAIGNDITSKKILRSLSDVIGVIEIDDIEDKEFKIIYFIDDLLHRMPRKIELDTEQNYVLSNEINTYNYIVEVIKDSLVTVKQSLSGLKPLSTELEDAASDILNGRVPKPWKKLLRSGDVGLSEFVDDLDKNTNYLRAFKDDNIFWLAAFLFPKALFCKIKLDTSLRYKIPVEDLEFTSEVSKTEDIDENIEGIVIKGLCIANAMWDYEHQLFCEITSSCYNPFPSILMKPVKDVLVFELPLYQTFDLKVLICTIKIKSTNKQTRWKKRGIKLFSRFYKRIESDINRTNLTKIVFERNANFK